MITVYGIPNCDTMKKARKWLDENNIDYAFHDYKKQGISKAKLKDWCTQADWEVLLNRRGTTWRKLDDETKAAINKTLAIDIMAENTSVIKRPVVETADDLLVGFSAESFEAAFK
ncbi:MAG: ArsC family reductase [Gammaproteobacteria bacterium]|nr:ArsC family reductase [Gammaproteobacteria bacterium]